eukprot:TRINITY_DN14962_c0_g1_i6.p1 TRINITY_DN14962_c0_g1~~TRINITY_DN14962_c0_g1_i6.p1  ORF type:complete len:368 (+),score=61.62 TRINITY_DN14962_c0_g1_i6:117-1106(+)
MDPDHVGNRNFLSRVLENFLQDYIEYLSRVISATLICSVSSVSNNREEHFADFSSDVKTDAEHLRVVLRKIIRGFSVIIEVLFENSFVCCNFFLTDIPKSLGWDDMKLETVTPHFSDHTQASMAVELSEMTKLSTATHLNSFLYDFHLRHLLTYLQLDRISLSLRDVLHSFREIYFQPPPFSRNYAVWRKFSVHLSAISNQTNIRFYRYLCVNSSAYELGSSSSPTMDDPCLFCVLSDIRRDDSRIDMQFAFIALLDSNSVNLAGELSLELFVFRVDPLNHFPYVQPHSIVSFHSTVSHDNLKEHCEIWDVEARYLKNSVCPAVASKLT